MVQADARNHIPLPYSKIKQCPCNECGRACDIAQNFDGKRIGHQRRADDRYIPNHGHGCLFFLPCIAVCRLCMACGNGFYQQRRSENCTQKALKTWGYVRANRFQFYAFCVHCGIKTQKQDTNHGVTVSNLPRLSPHSGHMGQKFRFIQPAAAAARRAGRQYGRDQSS